MIKGRVSNIIIHKFLIILLIILPTIYAIAWHIIDNTLPDADGAVYFFESVRFYQDFIDDGASILGVFEGLVEGLWGIYADRGERPISFAAFAVPFLLFSNGNWNFSYGAVGIVTILIFVIYTYNIIKLTTPRLIAAICASIIGVTPAIQSYAIKYFAETALTTSIVACIFHLIKSEQLKNKKHSILFAIILAIALTIRPIEGALIISAPLICFLYNGVRTKNFLPKEISLIIFVGLIITTLAFYIPYLTYASNGKEMFSIALPDYNNIKTSYRATTYILSLITIVFSIVFILYFKPKLARFFSISKYWQCLFKHNDNKSYLMLSFALFYLISFIWWGIDLNKLFEWSYLTSFGSLIQSSPAKTINLPLLQKIDMAIRYNATSLFYILLYSNIITLALNRKNISQKAALILLISSTVLPILMLLFSPQSDPRRLASTTPILMIIMFMVLYGNKQLHYVKNLFLIIVFILYTLAISSSSYYKYTPQLLKPYISGGYHLAKKYDATLTTYQYLNKTLERYGFKNIRLNATDAFDPFRLTNMIRFSKKNYRAAYMYTPTYDSNTYKQVQQQNFDAMLFAHPLGKMDDSEEGVKRLHYYYQCSKPTDKCFRGFSEFGSNQLNYEVAIRVAERRLEEAGWKLIEQIEINGYDVYLIKILQAK